MEEGSTAVSHFDFGKKIFNGDKAAFPLFDENAISTGKVNEVPHEGLLRCEFDTPSGVIAWLGGHEHYEDLPLDANNQFVLSDDPLERKQQVTLKKVARIALMKMIGPVAKRHLKKVGVLEGSIFEIMQALRAEYGTADTDDIAAMELPISTIYEPTAGQTIEEYAETHFVAHEQIAAFDDGIHKMNDTQKINAFCKGLRPCGKFARQVQATSTECAGRRILFEDWITTFLKYVKRFANTETTVDYSYAASARGRGETVADWTQTPEFIAAVAAAVVAHQQSSNNNKKKPKHYTHWCYFHGPNNKHNNDTCLQKDTEIPPEKMKSTAANPMGGSLVPWHIQKRNRKF